jgi:RadC-like JAB domain
VHPREAIKARCLANAAAVVAAHNHPSGDPEPSPDDIGTTLRLREAFALVGVDLLDSIIIGEAGRWASRVSWAAARPAIVGHGARHPLAGREHPMAAPKAAKRVTPRRGVTTVTTGGMHRKTVYFSPQEWEAIRREAFLQDRAYTDIIRDAVRRMLRLKTPSEEDS